MLQFNSFRPTKTMLLSCKKAASGPKSARDCRLNANKQGLGLFGSPITFRSLDAAVRPVLRRRRHSGRRFSLVVKT
jgi:hypothetical protein